MDAKEAKELIEKSYGSQGRLVLSEEKAEFNKAKGYLAALEGEEVKVLVEALEKIIDLGNPLEAPKNLYGMGLTKEIAEEALQSFHEQRGQ